MATYTKSEVDKMTSEQYKENFNNDPEFRVYIDGAYNNASSTSSTPKRPAGNVRGPEPTPAMSFDPSFDDGPNSGPSSAAAPADPSSPRAEQPAAVVPAPVSVATEELPEKIHEYQPLSRDGRPIGGKQVFKYRTDAELIQKLTAAHMASSARIRELSRDKALEKIAAAGLDEKNFAPSTEVPKTMEELTKELLEQRQQNFLLAVRESLNAFQLSTDWAKYRSDPENAKSLILAIEKAGDDPSRVESYHRAFANMKDFLVPEVAAPVAAPVSIAAPVATPIPVRPGSVPRGGISSGLSALDGGGDNQPVEPVKVQGVKITLDGRTQVMDFRSYDNLPSEIQRRILKSPSNARAVESLFEAENQRRVAVRR